jgi:hypothetical protein
MIQSLIIGTSFAVEQYMFLLSKSKYYGKNQCLVVDDNQIGLVPIDLHQFDAVFIVSPLRNSFLHFEAIFKAQINLYFVDQPFLNAQELLQLEKIQSESGNFVFIEKVELENPLTDEFLTTSNSYLLFHYTKSIANKRNIRYALFSALCFLSVLSPMQVKKIDVNTMDTTIDERPIIKIRLKMFDSSLCYILLKLDNKSEYNMLIETKIGNFSFNLADNYLENIHGKRFIGNPITADELLLKSIESFAIHIIMNKKPKFNFHSYSLVIRSLARIESILQNSM